MRRPLALGAGALIVLLLLWAGVLAARAYEDWQSLQRPPAIRLQDTSRIQPWMTVRFIAISHRVPIGSLAAQLDAPPAGDVTLIQLARARGVPVAQEVDAARRSVADIRAETTVPTPPPDRDGP